MSAPDMCPLDKHRIWKFKVFRFCGFLAIPFGIFGAIGGFFMTQQFQAEAEEAKGWPSTAGTVLESRVEERVSEGKVFVAGRQRTVTTRDYLTHVTVKFSVDGEEFETDNVHRMGKMAFSKREDAQSHIAPYQVGHEVKVFYDPENPSEAMLALGSNMDLNPVSKAAGGLMFTFFGMIVVAIFSALIKMIESKYEEVSLDTAPDGTKITDDNMADLYPGLESAKYFANRS